MKKISFKVSDDEARDIRRQAKQEHLTVSEFLRRRAVPSSGGQAAIARVKCEFTGAEIFGPLSPAAPLTTAGIHEMLADFP